MRVADVSLAYLFVSVYEGYGKAESTDIFWRNHFFVVTSYPKIGKSSFRFYSPIKQFRIFRDMTCGFEMDWCLWRLFWYCMCRAGALWSHVVDVISHHSHWGAAYDSRLLVCSSFVHCSMWLIGMRSSPLYGRFFGNSALLSCTASVPRS